jgi:hypothetical protein
MSKTRISIVSFLFAFVYACAYASAVTGVPTTTKLSITPRQVAIGAPVTLTATVLLGTIPVRHGTVVFCDASAARCQGLAILGSAQLTSPGTATVKLTLGAGVYSLKAVFQGTPRTVPPASGSLSAAQAVTVDHRVAKNGSSSR